MGTENQGLDVTPAKLLIAQRLMESAHELRAIVALMDEYKHDPAWLAVAQDLTAAAATAQWWANEVRAER
jgi:hypothetical protein